MAELASSVDCPKCGAPPTTAANCPKCGLAKDRWSTFAANEEAKVTAPIRLAWDTLVEHWDEPKRHTQLLNLASEKNVFAWVGAKYRVKAKEGDPVAVEQLEKLKKQAEVTLLATAERPPDNAKRNRTIALAIAAIVLAVAGYMIYAGTQRSGNHSAQTTTAP